MYNQSAHQAVSEKVSWLVMARIFSGKQQIIIATFSTSTCGLKSDPMVVVVGRKKERKKEREKEE